MATASDYLWVRRSAAPSARTRISCLPVPHSHLTCASPQGTPSTWCTGRGSPTRSPSCSDLWRGSLSLRSACTSRTGPRCMLGARSQSYSRNSTCTRVGVQIDLDRGCLNSDHSDDGHWSPPVSLLWGRSKPPEEHDVSPHVHTPHCSLPSSLVSKLPARTTLSMQQPRERIPIIAALTTHTVAVIKVRPPYGGR